ncbi:MAG: Gfo/Idh/MocA family oxidoreductase [Kiritimatiellae bacterium]|nr:Gfo/Idh/MocA family oxidoreductase [Kiritimatiellia bacterium]
MPSRKKVRVAVIGCGVISELHLRCFAHNPDAEVAAVCDLVPERARRAARERAPGARWTTRAADVFADPGIDAVSVCTDHASHAALACAALAAGKHVLCEKSLARTAGDLRRMLAAAAARPDLAAAAVFQHRFEPLPRVLRELVAEGAFGRLVAATGSLWTLRDDAYFRKDAWRGTRKGEGGSVLINQAIHYFDLLLWIAGGADAARAFAANLGHEGVIETEDTVAVALRMRGGALGSFTATSAGMPQWRSALVFQGSAGCAEMRDDRLFSLSLADKAAEKRVRARVDRALAAGADLFPKGRDYYGPGHQAQIDDFVRAVRTGRRPFVTFADAAETDALVFAAYASAAREGRASR